MRCFHIFLACGLVFAPCLSGLAEEPAAKLPADGWWIRYFATIKQEGKGELQEYTAYATYSLVGTAVEEGEKCRWVEIKYINIFGDKKHTVLLKYLVPEKDLLESEQPLEKLKRAWVKVNERDVLPVEIGKLNLTSDTTLMIFPGKWRKAELVDSKRTVDYQKGRRTINQARTKTTSYTVANNRPAIKQNQELVITNDYTVWFDSASSPVFTAVKIQSSDNDVPRSTRLDDLVMEDTGTDAKSDLPDRN